MPIRTPPQHNTTNPPGQTGSSYRAPSQERAGPLDNGVKTLGDYVKQTEESEARLLKKKLTFRQWFLSYAKEGEARFDKDCMEDAWNAAQENV
jgi:hypothetical protein